MEEHSVLYNYFIAISNQVHLELCGFQKLVFWSKKYLFFYFLQSSHKPIARFFTEVNLLQGRHGCSWSKEKPRKPSRRGPQHCSTGDGSQLTPCFPVSPGPPESRLKPKDPPSSSRGADRLQKVAIKWEQQRLQGDINYH